MIRALLLVDGQDVREDDLPRGTGGIHVIEVLGRWIDSYVVCVWVLDPEWTDQSQNEHLETALREIAQVAGITRVVTLALKP